MRYIDSGMRAAADTLGAWLQLHLNQTISEVRWQVGFYSADALGLFQPVLARLSAANQVVSVLVGSNSGKTVAADVKELRLLMGLPRVNGRLGVVNYDNAFFHPKTYHFKRDDGSQCAYVGSSNLTPPGIELHVEAGITLDTREGDPVGILDQVAGAVDAWFNLARPGLYVVTDDNAVDQLVADTILAAAPVSPPVRPAARPSAGAAGGQAARAHVNLARLINVPAYQRQLPTPTAVIPIAPVPIVPAAVVSAPVVPTPIVSAPAGTAPAHISIHQNGFPNYLFFDPTATATPTRMAQALTGTPLGYGAAGIVIQLSKDTARIFKGRKGTANISIPAEVAPTLRFGIYKGKYLRPRAEYDLYFRYLGVHNFAQGPASTNVMAYGFAAGESGHGDLRMLVPSDVKELAEQIKHAGLSAPSNGDPAILEWPTPQSPDFGLTFIQSGSALFTQAQNLLAAANTAGRSIGNGACWLPAGLSPIW